MNMMNNGNNIRNIKVRVDIEQYEGKTKAVGFVLTPEELELTDVGYLSYRVSNFIKALWDALEE